MRFSPRYDADAHMAEASRLGLTNIAQAWDYGRNGHTRETMETLMREPFTYAFPPTTGEGVPDDMIGTRVPYEPWALYRAIGMRQFLHRVVNMTPDGNGYQTGDMSNPVLGEMGMANEFIAQDAGGERSHPKYVTKGLTTNLFLAALVLSQGDWPDDEDGRALASRVRVGVIDFRHKTAHGWYGTQNGGSPSRGVTYSYEYIRDGLNFAVDIFDGYLNGSMPGTRR